MLKILYLVHDLNDPSIRRRVLMMQAGGASVALAGFVRNGQPVKNLAGVEPILLGTTQDGKLTSRALSVGLTILFDMPKFAGCVTPNVVLARNLEMLAVAARVKSIFGKPKIPIIYEMLDVHRAQLKSGYLGWMLRSVERVLTNKTKLILTSSPAFILNYFERFGQNAIPIKLVENKLLELGGSSSAATLEREPPTSPPWQVGWYGTLRCRTSVQMLSEFTRAQGGQFKVVLRGKPSLSAHDNFCQTIDAEPHLSYLGPYRNPEDMGEIYSQVHFSWLVDFFEEGQNSKWLLPNRLYEGCRFGCVPIAIQGTQTAEFLKEREIGLILPDASQKSLSETLGSMTLQRYSKLRQAVLSLDRKTWIYTREDCSAFVNLLAQQAMQPAVKVSETAADRDAAAGVN